MQYIIYMILVRLLIMIGECLQHGLDRNLESIMGILWLWTVKYYLDKIN